MSNSLTAEVLRALAPCPGLTVVITVGNSLRCDDGIGPYIASRLTKRESLAIIDAGQAPERIIDEVTQLKPTHIIIIDAADFGGEAGEVRLIDKEHIPETTLSTHLIPLNVITQLLSTDTGAAISFIGIQPRSVSFGEELSRPVKNAADTLVTTIQTSFH